MVTPAQQKRVLMVAFHFPPQRGSSGVQRTLKFSRYLGSSGWQPLVLSAHPRAYTAKGDDQLRDVAPDLVVRRAFALDTSRHLAFKGRYFGALALPDRWVTWLLGAVPAGLRMIRTYRPQVIWSTYPIATAHLIGLTLHRLTGLPWVADLRDPMIDDAYPSGRLTRAIFRWIETQTVRHAVRVVCTTPGAITAYRTTYPELPPERFALIENGYDEENFRDAETLAVPRRRVAGEPLLLLHSGIIYPSERDPTHLFEALAALLKAGRISPATLNVRLRAAVHDAYLEAMIARYAIGSIVTVAPHLPYREALTEMLSADALLVLQAANCNAQIPAKIYEYLRARRPILALTDATGDTATTLRCAGIDTIGPLDVPEAIAQTLMRFLDQVGAGTAPLPTPKVIEMNSRRARTVQLAALLDQVAARPNR
ncbi:MAG TPA: glycosyltransferase [Telluria sp.]